MNQNTRHFQKGMIDWKWIVAVSALVAAFIVYYRSGVRIVNPGPSAPVLIEPAAGALVDVDDSVTRFVWQHNDNVEFHFKIVATLSNQWGPLQLQET